jgi:26S proteasome regulatory subunit N10
VSLIFTAKTQSNPENTVGLMTLGGTGPEVKVTLSSDFGKILAGIHDTKVHGDTHLATGIQVAAVCFFLGYILSFMFVCPVANGFSLL